MLFRHFLIQVLIGLKLQNQHTWTKSSQFSGGQDTSTDTSSFETFPSMPSHNRRTGGLLISRLVSQQPGYWSVWWTDRQENGWMHGWTTPKHDQKLIERNCNNQSTFIAYILNHWHIKLISEKNDYTCFFLKSFDTKNIMPLQFTLREENALYEMWLKFWMCNVQTLFLTTSCTMARRRISQHPTDTGNGLVPSGTTPWPEQTIFLLWPPKVLLIANGLQLQGGVHGEYTTDWSVELV